MAADALGWAASVAKGFASAGRDALLLTTGGVAGVCVLEGAGAVDAGGVGVDGVGGVVVPTETELAGAGVGAAATVVAGGILTVTDVDGG